jgi:hypothetical protein
MVMVKVLRSGMVLRRLLASLIAKMPSIRRSTSKVTSFQTKMKTMRSQIPTPMDSPLQLKLAHHGGPMVMVRAQRNGTLLKRLPASPTAKKSSTSK